jgi:thiol-disulfide isomerase/thioredoxin
MQSTAARPRAAGAVRRFLAALAALLATLPLAAARADQQPARVEWTDVPLLDGRVLRGAELAQRTVVVQIWASWCPFCARQNPHVQALHERHGKELLVLTFSIDRTPQAARDYLKKHGYTFAAAMGTPQLETWFGLRRALPDLFVVQRGRIVLHEPGELFPEDIAALGRFADAGAKGK